MALSNEEIMLKERMRFVLTQKRMTIAKFADNDETARCRYGHQINGSGTVPYNTIYKMLYMFPDISPTWLILGEGTMKRQDETAPRFYTYHNEKDSFNNVGGDINIGPEVNVDKRILDLQRQLDEVTRDRDLLKNLLAAMTGSGTRK